MTALSKCVVLTRRQTGTRAFADTRAPLRLRSSRSLLTEQVRLLRLRRGTNQGASMSISKSTSKNTLRKAATARSPGWWVRRNWWISALVAVGVIAGMIMNLNQNDQFDWSDGGILLSLVLFFWLVAATATEFFYSPASRGRKAFYMTLASLGFLVLALLGVIFSSHGVS